MTKENTYRRDKRSPTPKSEAVSRVMSANKSKNTKPEILFRKALWKAGFRGYRLHQKKLPGRPDIAFTTKKVAIFVNGCFWHRCPHCKLKLPKSNTQFWEEKFTKNIRRDQAKQAELAKHDWKVLVVWECELKKNMEAQVEKVKKLLGDIKKYEVEQEEFLKAAEEEELYGNE
ncbi:very short patch repair endonuclease [Sungkyunkwania multivorans]|uniref:Very short patch repair endonuclease n=1 Tax=Sungkyunkwania multivorans TaxID=1173618 RepID=A0ABW3CZG2_9FLAO